MKEKRERDGFFEYASRVHSAKLTTSCKVLLWHYGYAFNWNEKRPSYYSQKSICSLTGMSPSSYQKARKRLLELGWIIERKRGRRQSILVTPLVGRDDEEVVVRFEDYQSDDVSLDEAIRNLPDEFFNPFGDEGKAAS